MVKCLNCGKDVEEGVSVCPNCGTSIRTVEIGAGKKTKGSKKKFIFLAVGLVILFAVILAVIMLIGGKKKRPVMEDGSHAYIDVSQHIEYRWIFVANVCTSENKSNNHTW